MALYEVTARDAAGNEKTVVVRVETAPGMPGHRAVEHSVLGFARTWAGSKDEDAYAVRSFLREFGLTVKR